jgi:hypothetical protein
MPHVGFWKDLTGGGWYPGKIVFTALPEPNSASADQGAILSLLVQVEAVAQRVDYLGASSCRVCGCANGCGEYTYAGFTWPSGYAHYLRDHSVAINSDFKEMLLKVGAGIQ